ncbi:MAG: DUF2274 domain-containing protein [Sphingomonas sp.]
MDLKLPKLPERTPVKLLVSMPPALHQDLGDYAALYAETYGQAEAVADLVPYMLRSFLESDRAFARRSRPGGKGEGA